MKLAIAVGVGVCLLHFLHSFVSGSDDELILEVMNATGNRVDFRCFGTFEGDPPQPQNCYFRLNFSAEVSQTVNGNNNGGHSEILLEYTLTPKTEATFFCECNSTARTFSSKGMRYAAIQEYNTMESVDAYRGQQVNLQCPFVLGNLHTIISPYEICWRNLSCLDSIGCCLNTSSYLTLSDTNLTISEANHNQEYFCSLYLKRCDICKPELFGNVTFAINILDRVNITDHSGSTAVYQGENVQFNCTAEGTNIISAWTVNGILVKNENEFLIRMRNKSFGQTTSLTFNTSSYNTSVTVICLFQQIGLRNESRNETFLLAINTDHSSSTLAPVSGSSVGLVSPPDAIIGGVVGAVIFVGLIVLFVLVVSCCCCFCNKGTKSYPVAPPTTAPQPKRPVRNAIYEELPCGPIYGTEPPLLRQVGIEHDPTLVKHENASYHGSDEPLCGSSDVSGLSGVSGNVPGAHKMPFYNDESDRFLAPPLPWKTVSNSTFNTTATHSTVISCSDSEDYPGHRPWNSEVHYPQDGPLQHRRSNSQCVVDSVSVNRNRSASFSNGVPQPHRQCQSCRYLPFDNAPFASNFSMHKHTISSASSGTNSASNSPYHQGSNVSPYHQKGNVSPYHQGNNVSLCHHRSHDSSYHQGSNVSSDHKGSDISADHRESNSPYIAGEMYSTPREPHQPIIPEIVNYLLDHVQHSRNCQLPGCCCRRLKSLSNLADSETCKPSDYKSRKTSSTVTSSSTESESDTPDHKTKKRAMHLQLSKEPDEDLYPHNHLSTESYKIRSKHRRSSSRRRSRSLADLTPITEMRETPTPAIGGPVVPGTPVYPPKSLGDDGCLDKSCVGPSIPGQLHPGSMASYLQPRPQILKQRSISTDNVPVLCLNDCVAKLTTPSPTKHSIYLTSNNAQTGGIASLKTVPENGNSETDGSNTSSRSRSPPEPELGKSSQSDNEDPQYNDRKSSLGRHESLGYESGDTSSLKRLGSYSRVESSGYESGGGFSVSKSRPKKNIGSLPNQRTASKPDASVIHPEGRKLSVNSLNSISKQDCIIPSRTPQTSRSSSPFETETKRGNDGALIQTTEC